MTALDMKRHPFDNTDIRAGEIPRNAFYVRD